MNYAGSLTLDAYFEKLGVEDKRCADCFFNLSSFSGGDSARCFGACFFFVCTAFDQNTGGNLEDRYS